MRRNLMSLASSLRAVLDEARVALASHPAVARIESHFQSLNEAGEDPGAREKALEIVKGLYEAALPTAATVAEAEVPAAAPETVAVVAELEHRPAAPVVVADALPEPEAAPGTSGG
jgi:hypothetical protein